MTQSNDRAQRGKGAEKEVHKLLTRWNTEFSDFSFYRMPDARAAMGRMKASPGDFLYFNGDYGGFIEVKETAHDFRLASDKISQVPTLRKFAMAGARSIVVIYHSKLDKWRCCNLEWFQGTPPSWDLTPLPLFDTAEQALNSINWR